MKQGAGYTIVEVMIVLAVTAGMLLAAMAIFSGQQGKTDFTTSAREMESRLQDIVNDVSTGFYSRPGNFNCQASLTGPQFSAGSQQQGTNEDCIFIGRVAHFDLAGGGGNQYNVYSVAGLRTAGSGVAKREAQGFTDAKPQAVVNPVDLTQHDQLPSGLKFGTMFYDQGGVATPIDAIGFFSSFSAYQGSSLTPGSISVNVVPIIGAGGGSSDQATMTTAIAAVTDASLQNPNGGVVVCLNSATTNQYAKFTIGGFGRQLTTNLEIKNGTCPAALLST